VIVCVGSGGVGKTTMSAAIALQGAALGRSVCVLTIDPARRLAPGRRSDRRRRCRRHRDGVHRHPPLPPLMTATGPTAVASHRSRSSRTAASPFTDNCPVVE